MSRLHYSLPPLTSLVTFETAARLGSFKNAAVELGVTPGAVSHQIKALEAELGTPLFIRQHRGVALTESAQLLFAALENAFLGVGWALQQVRRQSLEPIVTVGSTTAVSSLLMTPALISFWRQFEDTAVNQQVSDQRFTGVELPDLFVTYGQTDDKSLDQWELFRDTLVPVCSPELAQRLTEQHGQDVDALSLAVLSQQKLIHLEALNENWTDWQHWFTALGHQTQISRRQGTQVNNYTIALQVAQDGAGIVLGWRRLIKPILDTGRLVVASNWSLPAPSRFFLVSRSADQLSESALTLRNWLRKHL